MNDQAKAIVAHLFLIGWIITLVINLTDKKTPLASFYLRQTFGIYLIGCIGYFIPLLSWLISLVALVACIYSLVGAAQNRELLLPVVGEYFQEWFKGL